jgi:hypothetical protein
MWNQLPQLPDRLNLGSAHGEGVTPGNNVMFHRRRFPTEDEIITKIHEVRRDWEDELASSSVPDESKRMRLEGWDMVVSSADLLLNSDQMAVSNVVDMEIARRAAVFIGNGVRFQVLLCDDFLTIFLLLPLLLLRQWSSMSSNIVHRRLVDGHPFSSNRFF